MKNKRHFLSLVILALFLTFGFQTWSHAETDVTGSVGLVKSALGYNRANKSSYLDVSVRNTGSDPLLAPLKVVIDSISTSAVTVANADGVTSDGKPYFQYSFANSIPPGQLTTAKRWIFSNPTQTRFSYTIKGFGSLSYLRINGMNPSAALPGETLTVKFSGDSGIRPIQVALSSLTFDAVVVSENTATFTVPAGEQTGPLFLSQGGRVSNSVILNISDVRVVTPTTDEIVLDELGTQVAVNLIIMSMKSDHNTYAEASRVAGLQSCTIVGRLPLIDGYQVRLTTRTLNELRAAIAVLQADPAVDFALIDSMVKPFQIEKWDNQFRPGQFDSNRVIEGASWYINNVSPTDPTKIIRPKAVKIGVVEKGLDFTVDDFKGYATGVPEQYSIVVYGDNLAPKDLSCSENHGTTVTGVIAARLWNGRSTTGRNAGLLAALGKSPDGFTHGGFNIEVSNPSGFHASGIHATNSMLLNGASVINWSFGLIKEGTLDRKGSPAKLNLKTEDDFNIYRILYERLLRNFESKYPNVVIVAAANNSVVRVEDDKVVPSGIPSPSMIVVGGNDYDETGQASFWDWLDHFEIGSGYGNQVDILAAAPVQMSSSNRDGNNITCPGTSFSAPLVTATVAAMQSINPNLTPSQIRHLLRSSAIGIDASVTDLTGSHVATRPLTVSEVGAGLSMPGQAAVLNVEGAIQAAIAPSAPVLIPLSNNSSLVNPNNIEFRWQPSVDPDGYPVTYCITIREVGVIVPVYSGCDPGSNTFFQISLSPGKTYSWSVTAKDSQGFESPTSSASFTTMAAYKVSGKVTSGGIGLEGVAVTLEGVGATTTDPGGNYQFIDVLEDTYNISFAKAGYTFNPPQHMITFEGADFVLDKEGLPLTTGPTLEWNTFLGSSSNDYGYGLAVDSSGNTYISGYSYATWGSPIRPFSGQNDTFVAKLNSSGVLQWNTFWGDTSEWGGVAVDTSGNVYITGYSYATWGSPIRPFSSWIDAFVAKLNSSGDLQWNTFLGYSNGEDKGIGVAVDTSGNVYITGHSWATWGTPIWPYSGTSEAFVAKLSSGGDLQWNTFLGSASIDGAFDLALDTSGNIYIAGFSAATWGTPIRPYSGGYDAFVAKIKDHSVIPSYPEGIIELPKTGQTRCWDSSGSEIPCAGTGQDGDIQAGVAWPNPRFSVSGDCVTDNLTGLMWAKNGNLPNGTLSWQGGLDYVASINSGTGLCGQHDWRLPNVNELESMVNADLPNSATWLNSQGFINVQSNYYRSSTSNPYSTAWTVDMRSGFVGGSGEGYSYPVWPVRSGMASAQAPLWQTGQTACHDTTTGEVINCSGTGQDGEQRKGVPWPSPRFEVIGDCVTDNLTGLKWARNANLPNSTLTWQGALDYTASLNSGSGLCGYHDWRLPNRKELRSLVDYSQVTPALPLNHLFTNVQSNHYWSSSTNATNPNNAWIVGFNSEGYLSCDIKGSNYILPVRAGQ